MTSLSGSFLTISRKIFASKAIIPFSKISPSIIVSIPSSISFAVSLISPFDASIRIHSSIDIVVLLGTALETVFTPFKRFVFEHMIFMCITPFAVIVIFQAAHGLLKKYIIIYKSVVIIVIGVEM